MRIPNGAATVNAEGSQNHESESLEYSEKAVARLMRHKSGDLLNFNSDNSHDREF